MRCGCESVGYQAPPPDRKETMAITTTAALPVTSMQEEFQTTYERDWNDPAGDDMKAIWTKAWVASQKAQVNRLMMTATQLRSMPIKGKIGDWHDAPIQTLIKPHVDLAMAHQFRLELVHPHTQQRMTPAQREEFLTLTFAEIAKGMGIDRFMQTPAERLDQFAVMSVMKNHDTAGLLRSLVNSFMIAYACPETSERAFAALVQIEGLRAEVADSKGQGQMTNKPELQIAARELEAILGASAGPNHTQKTPLFKVLVGADRIFVKSGYPLKDVPKVFMGFAVEPIVGHSM